MYRVSDHDSLSANTLSQLSRFTTIKSSSIVQWIECIRRKRAEKIVSVRLSNDRLSSGAGAEVAAVIHQGQLKNISNIYNYCSLFTSPDDVEKLFLSSRFVELISEVSSLNCFKHLQHFQHRTIDPW